MECNYVSENCRACQIKTEEESQKIFIFDTEKLPDIFKETTSLDIHENDGLPGVLCFSCYDRLLEAYNFRKMCSAAVLHFRKIMSMDIPEEKYTPPETTDVLTVFTPMNIKAEPDSYDPGFSPNREDYLCEISNRPSIDEKPLIHKRDPDDGTSLSFPKLKETHNKMTDMDVPGTMICSICDSRFQQKSRLEMHIRKKHLGLKPYECKICGKGFKTSSGLKVHIETERPKRSCMKNNPSLTYYQEDTDKLKSHMETNKIHQGVKDYYCSRCNRSFATVTILRHHMMRHEGIKNHECTICGVRKVTNYELSIHMNTHTKEKMWDCEFCSHKFSIRLNLQRHLKTVHHGIRDYHCTICEKSFKNSKNLKYHLMLHSGEKPYACSQCPKRFITKDQLRTHKKVHSGEYFVCEFCPFKTIYRAQLTRHVKVVHQKVKDFHCPYCKRSFGNSRTLKNHVLTHTGEKPHACVECERKFITPTALKYHMKSHESHDNSGSGPNLDIKQELII
uniref:Uncharacterized protein n=1 Tax=Phlebotomus papatasi TaxID=29031 RepID=A0A1B0DQD5_PHLPP